MLFLLLFTTVNGMSGSESEIFSQRDFCDTDAFRFKKRNDIQYKSKNI